MKSSNIYDRVEKTKLFIYQIDKTKEMSFTSIKKKRVC